MNSLLWVQQTKILNQNSYSLYLQHKSTQKRSKNEGIKLSKHNKQILRCNFTIMWKLVNLHSNVSNRFNGWKYANNHRNVDPPEVCISRITTDLYSNVENNEDDIANRNVTRNIFRFSKCDIFLIGKQYDF